MPRTSASPAFTREVMRRTREDEAQRPLVKAWSWRFAAAFAMAACLVVAVQLAVVGPRRHAQTVALRAEQQKLQQDLAAVKKIADETEPVVVLENEQGTRVIMDLDSAAAQPASLRNYD